MPQHGTQASIVDPLVLLQQQNPDLPMIPATNSAYGAWEIWFGEAMRQIALASTRRTREETLKINDQLLHYQLQILTYLKNKRNIREVDELADLEFDAKKHDLLVRIARSKAEIKALNDPNQQQRGYIDV